VSIEIEDHDLGWNDILESVETASGKSTKAGVVGVAARRREPSGLTVATVAMVHEFGSEAAHVPERAFIRTAIDKHEGELVKELTIRAGLEPPLAESTIEQKREHGDSETRPLGGWLAESQGHEESDHDDGEADNE
jgi:hypothetical protein